jgi:protein-S-isoprenylcysteine O-methyltransferase Ste14
VTVSAEDPGGDGTTTGQATAPHRDVVAGSLRLVATTVVYGSALFACAGTLAWPPAWAYLGVMTAGLAAYAAIISRRPDLIAERRRPPADAKRWDRPLVAVVAVVGPVALVLSCGLDHRFHWSPRISPWWNAAGLAMVASGTALSNWAVAANRFFSALIRVQRDRGHHVVDTGPYRVVRHPGYLASLVYMAGAALALGSVWALAISAAVGVVVIVRTALEDRTLRTELKGYEEYASRVRYRLLPGVW